MNKKGRRSALLVGILLSKTALGDMRRCKPIILYESACMDVLILGTVPRTAPVKRRSERTQQQPGGNAVLADHVKELMSILTKSPNQTQSLRWDFKMADRVSIAAI